MARQRSKDWCFTLNNPTEDDCTLLEELAGSIEDGTGSAVYLLIGDEVGDSGTPHMQGFVAFSGRVGVRECKRLIGPRSHLEPRKGSVSQAIDYCKKDGKWFHYGTPPKGQGARSDLESIRAQIRDGVSDLDIANENFGKWCIYRRAFSEYRGMVQGRRNWETLVYVLMGSTGTGKSRIAHACSSDLWVASDNSGRWFDGYSGQKDVLFDDFTGDGAKMGFFLQLLDRYAMSVPVKGGFVNWTPRRIFFTSNVDIEQWFVGANPEQYKAFLRRVTQYWIIKEEVEFSVDNKPLEDRFACLFE